MLCSELDRANEKYPQKAATHRPGCRQNMAAEFGCEEQTPALSHLRILARKVTVLEAKRTVSQIGSSS